MHPKTEELQNRTRRFLTRVIRFCESLPKTQAAGIISGQLTRSAEIGEPRARQELLAEANELTAIFVASEKTAKRLR